MLIACQKFRSRMLGYYIRSCHVITRNMHETWGLFYSRAMSTLTHHATFYCMCSDIMRTSRGAHMQASRLPQLYMVHQKLLMDVPFAQAELYLSKISASHFSTLNTKIANQNVLKRILIAMLNENMAVPNENFSI